MTTISKRKGAVLIALAVAVAMLTVTFVAVANPAGAAQRTAAGAAQGVIDKSKYASGEMKELEGGYIDTDHKGWATGIDNYEAHAKDIVVSEALWRQIAGKEDKFAGVNGTGRFLAGELVAFCDGDTADCDFTIERKESAVADAPEPTRENVYLWRSNGDADDAFPHKLDIYVGEETKGVGALVAQVNVYVQPDYFAWQNGGALIDGSNVTKYVSWNGDDAKSLADEVGDISAEALLRKAGLSLSNAWGTDDGGFSLSTRIEEGLKEDLLSGQLGSYSVAVTGEAVAPSWSNDVFAQGYGTYGVTLKITVVDSSLSVPAGESLLIPGSANRLVAAINGQSVGSDKEFATVAKGKVSLVEAPNSGVASYVQYEAPDTAGDDSFSLTYDDGATVSYSVTIEAAKDHTVPEQWTENQFYAHGDLIDWPAASGITDKTVKLKAPNFTQWGWTVAKSMQEASTNLPVFEVDVPTPFGRLPDNWTWMPFTSDNTRILNAADGAIMKDPGSHTNVDLRAGEDGQSLILEYQSETVAYIPVLISHEYQWKTFSDLSETIKLDAVPTDVTAESLMEAVGLYLIDNAYYQAAGGDEPQEAERQQALAVSDGSAAADVRIASIARNGVDAKDAFANNAEGKYEVTLSAAYFVTEDITFTVQLGNPSGLTAHDFTVTATAEGPTLSGDDVVRESGATTEEEGFDIAVDDDDLRELNAAIAVASEAVRAGEAQPEQQVSVTLTANPTTITRATGEPESVTVTATVTEVAKPETPTPPTTTTYTVTFDANGGEAFSPSSVSVEAGSPVSKPTSEPKRDGYRFLGWATERSSATIYDFATPVNASFTLYAQWEQSSDPDKPGEGGGEQPGQGGGEQPGEGGGEQPGQGGGDNSSGGETGDTGDGDSGDEGNTGGSGDSTGDAGQPGQNSSDEGGSNQPDSDSDAGSGLATTGAVAIPLVALAVLLLAAGLVLRHYRRLHQR